MGLIVSLFNEFFSPLLHGDYVLFGFFVVFALVLLAGVVGIGYLIFSAIFEKTYFSSEKTVEAKVIAMTFTAEHHSTNISPVFNSNGSTGMMVQSEDDPEQDIVVLKAVGIGRVVVDDAKLFDNVEQGEALELTYKEKYTYWSWKPEDKVFDKYVPTKAKIKSGEVITL